MLSCETESKNAGSERTRRRSKSDAARSGNLGLHGKIDRRNSAASGIGCARNLNGQRICARGDQSSIDCSLRVGDQRLGIGDVFVDRVVQMRAVRVVVAEADFPIVRELALDREIRCCANAYWKFLLHRNRKRQKR